MTTRGVDEKGLEVLCTAHAAFLKWQRSTSATDERTHGEQARAEALRLGAAMRELADALEPFAHGRLQRPVGAPDFALLGAAELAGQAVPFLEHARRLAQLRHSLAAMHYAQAGAASIRQQKGSRRDSVALAWVHCAADHWSAKLGKAPARKGGTFSRLLIAFPRETAWHAGPAPPTLASGAIESALVIWHLHNSLPK